MTDTLFYTDYLTREKQRLVLPDEELARSRIHGVYEEARTEEITAGMEWYFEAHDMCTRWSKEYRDGELSVEQVSGILAALSPIQSWERNIELAEALLVNENYSCRTLGYAQRDAKAILSGKDPEEVLFDEKRNNPKVRSFYSNISNPENPVPVTIDRHMIALITDNPGILNIQNWIKAGKYDWCAERFREVAAELDILPQQLQSIDWVTWRRMHSKGAVATSTQLSLLEV